MRNEATCASPTSEVTLTHIGLHEVFHSQRSDRATVAPHSIPVRFLRTLTFSSVHILTHSTVMSCHVTAETER